MMDRSKPVQNGESDGKKNKKNGASQETDLTKFKRQIATLQNTNRLLKLRLQAKVQKKCRTCIKLRKERDSLLRKFKNLGRENNGINGKDLGEVILLRDSDAMNSELRNPLDEALKEILFLKKIITCLTTKEDFDPHQDDAGQIDTMVNENELNNMNEDQITPVVCKGLRWDNMDEESDKSDFDHIGSMFGSFITDTVCKWIQLGSSKSCGKIFGTVAHLTAHVRQDHIRRLARPLNRLCCWEGCGRKGKPVDCRSTLLSHICIHTGEKEIRCEHPGCGKMFAERRYLQSHLETHKRMHPNEDDGLKEDGKESVDDRNKNDSVAVENVPIEENESENQNIILQELPVSKNDKERFCCCKCPKHFAHYKNLKVHEEECGKVFPCKTCGKELASSMNLRRHMKSVHEHVRPHMCHLCEKTFFSGGDLRRHIVSHSKLASYKCDFCDEEFLYKSNLARHKRKKHGN